MTDKIRMNFDKMEELARAFRDGSKTMEDINNQIGQIAGILEEGGLLGQTGSAFSNALRQDLMKNVKRIEDKLAEMEKDLRAAMQDMQSADKTAGGLYH
jgi:WXG100 family type VII secretion target